MNAKERRALITEGRLLLDRAEAEERDLTPAEAARYDEIDDQLRAAEEGPAMRPSLEARHNETGDLPDLGRVIRAHVRGDADGLTREERDLVGNLAGGSLVLPSAITANLLDYLRAESIALQAGTRVIDLDDRLYGVPRWNSDPTAYWVNEGAYPITESTPTLARADLKPKTVGALVDLSEELLADSPDLGDSLQRQIAGALAAEIDRVAFLGAGGGEPLGLFNDGDVSQNASLGASNLDALIDALSVIEGNNVRTRGPGNGVAICMGDDVAGFFDKKKDGNGAYQGFNAVDVLADKQILVSTAIPGKIAVGRFRDGLAFGRRSDVRIDVSRSNGSNFSQLMVSVRGWARCDFAVTRPGNFRLLAGVTS